MKGFGWAGLRHPYSVRLGFGKPGGNLQNQEGHLAKQGYLAKPRVTATEAKCKNGIYSANQSTWYSRVD
jgi:hypothetical protein